MCINYEVKKVIKYMNTYINNSSFQDTYPASLNLQYNSFFACIRLQAQLIFAYKIFEYGGWRM
jgi:hypothetical protein